jgi:hypothetical protein
MRTGSETIPGLGLRKQDICAFGGTALDLALAMLESKSMRPTYPLGDVSPNGRRKTGDAANFGVFKQNWLMIRSSWSGYASLSADGYLKGAVLNGNLRLDIEVLHASQRIFGLDRLWFSGHRNGLSGIRNPNTADIGAYRTAVYWIKTNSSPKAAA